LAGALTLAPRLPATESAEPPLILVNLSGRGDKDVATAITWFGLNTSGTATEAVSEAGATTVGTEPKS
jgi:tryptophan synthase beta chain